MKKKLRQLTTKYLYLFLLLAAVAVLAVSITVAAYTNQGYKKGVATTTAVDIPFSSDLLLQVSQKEDESVYKDCYREFQKSEAGAAQSFAVNIYNHVPNTPGKISTNDITYTLTVEINAPDGYTPATGYLLDGAAFRATATSEKVTLPRMKQSNHSHTITIPYQDIGQVTLTVTATPDVASSNALANKMLARVIRTRILSGTTDTANVWSGRLADRPGASAPTPTAAPSAFDAINYEVSGVGKGTITLQWPTSLLQIDPYFLSDTSVTFSDKDASDGNVTFTVDASRWNYRSIQFYRTAAPADNETWDQWQAETTGIVFTFTPPVAP